MRPISELRKMAVTKARSRQHRYAWAMDGEKSKPIGGNHIEIYDAEHDHLIAVVFSIALKDEIMAMLEAMEYVPSVWR